MHTANTWDIPGKEKMAKKIYGQCSKGSFFTLSSEVACLEKRIRSQPVCRVPQGRSINLSVGQKILNGAIPTDVSLHLKIAES